MSFVTTLPHILIFVALLSIYDGVYGLQITGLSPRKGPGHGGDAPVPTSSTSPVNIPHSTSSAFSSLISSTHNSLSTSSPLTSLASSTSPISSISAISSNSGVRLAESRHIGTIAGAVLGSVVLAGLGLMSLAYCRRRARKARKQPQGSDYFAKPQTEMVQTRNGPPLTSSAPLVHRPEPIHFFNASSSNPSSLSPLIATNSHDATSSYRPLSTSEPDNDFDVPSDQLQSLHGAQPFLSLDIPQPDVPQPERAVSAGPASSSTFEQLSPLHREMAGFQKALEADHKRDIPNEADPPPEYIG